mgnify:CR=1 FL=1
MSTETMRVLKPFGSVGRAWFRLTADEQKALALVIFIFLVGLAVKLWRMR